MGFEPDRLSMVDGRGGRNGVDWPHILPPNQLAEAINVDFSNITFARKRGGVAKQAFTGATFASPVSGLWRHVPDTSEAVAELWGAGGTAINRLAGGTAWTLPTFTDANVSDGRDVQGTSFNGKFFLAYESAQPRLHVWDPSATSGARVRRVGIAVMTTPSVVDTGVGAYAAVLRYYRTRAVMQSGGVTLQRSEPTASVAFTPSGGGTAAHIIRGTVPSENETHWEVEASTDNAFFFVIATVAAATTTYDDSAATTTYLNNPASPVLNTYRLPVSAKFIAADQSRLLLFGDFTTTNQQNRVYFTPVLGASGVSDDERVPLTNYVTLDEKDSGASTGLGGPCNGAMFAFKYRQIWKLTATGDATQPYSVFPISKSVGAINQRCIDVGEDEAGNAAIYFMSHRGPYRYGVNGLQYLGKHIEDRILPTGTTSVLDLTTPAPGWVRWYADRRQVWFAFKAWVPPALAVAANATAVFNLGLTSTTTNDPEVPSGWGVYPSAVTYPANIMGDACVMFSDTVGATMSLNLKPYIGGITWSASFDAQLGKADTGLTDGGAHYDSYVITRAINPYWPKYSVTVQNVTLISRGTSAFMTVSVLNVGSIVGTRSENVILNTGGSSETNVLRVGGDAQMANAPMVQFKIGTDEYQAFDQAWALLGLIVTTLQGTPFDA